MKNVRIAILVVLIAALGSEVFAGKDSTIVPQVVLDAFSKKYPSATNIEWEKDELNYEVEFEKDSMEYEATFSADGTWLETEGDIEENELPKKVMTAFKAKFPKAKIKEIEWVETPKSTFYEIEYKKRWKKREAIFDVDGNYLQDVD